MKHLSDITDWKEAINCVVQGDSLDLLKMIPDNAIDLCLTDPPYGIDIAKTGKVGGGKLANVKDYGASDWDSFIPTKEYFDEIMRISKNQIIFGGNYFELPPSSCWVVWDKDNGNTDFADCELAWTNFSTAVRKFRFKWSGMLQENMGKHKERRVHPTQKPLELMRWCLENYAKDCKTVIDPFCGSGTTGRACMDMGYDFIQIDKEEKYCRIAEERLKQQVLDLGS